MHRYVQSIVYMVAAILLGSAVILGLRDGHHEAWYLFSGVEFLTVISLAVLSLGVLTFAVGAAQPDKNIRPRR